LQEKKSENRIHISKQLNYSKKKRIYTIVNLVLE